MSANVTQGFLGSLRLEKVSGAGAVTNGTEFDMPFLSVVQPIATNDSYPAMVNGVVGPSTITRGKRTPGFGISTLAKSSWFTVAFLNSLNLTRDSNGDASVWAARMNEGNDTAVLYDGVKFGMVTMAHSAAGGPLTFGVDALAVTDAGVNTFGSSAVDAGYTLDSTSVDYGSSDTADLVRGWQLQYGPALAYDFFTARSIYPSNISSGQIGGTFTLEQSPKASIVPSSTITIRVYSGAVGSQTLVATATVKLNLDVAARTRTTAFGNILRTYSLIDASSGAAPIVWA